MRAQVADIEIDLNFLRKEHTLVIFLDVYVAVKTRF